MVNMLKLVKQAQSMQKNIEKLQAELAERQFEFSAGGGIVTAVVKGDMNVVRITIKPEAVDPSDVGMLEDLVVTAVNGALQAARETMSTEMAKVTGGMGGMGLPGF